MASLPPADSQQPSTAEARLLGFEPVSFVEDGERSASSPPLLRSRLPPPPRPRTTALPTLTARLARAVYNCIDDYIADGMDSFERVLRSVSGPTANAPASAELSLARPESNRKA